MPTSVLDFKNPFQTLHGHSPNFEKLRVFGCLCFPWIRPYASHKLDAKSIPCVFLGYSIMQCAYFFLDRSTSRIYTSRHVVFHEHVFPFSLPVHIESDNTADMDATYYTPVKLVSINTNPAGSVPSPQDQVVRTTTVSTEQSSVIPDTCNISPHVTTSLTPEIAETSSPSPPHQPQQDRPPVPIRHSTRQRKPVQKLNLHTKVVQTTEIPPTSVA